jgi:hypothetical protein
MSNIRNIYESLNPTNAYMIAVSTMRIVCNASICSGTILLVCLSIKGTTVYNCLIIITFVYLLHNGIISYQLNKVEFDLLMELEKYLGELRHYFYSSGMIEEAIYDSLEMVKDKISLHINKIYDILMSEDSIEVEQYKDIAPNKFFITFLALCQITIQYGDTIYQEQSLFLTNLNYLKNEINIEILKRKKMKHVFSGLIFVTIMPVFFLKIIENWSISNLEELKKYYYGAYGIIVSVVIFLVTLFTYHTIHRLKSNDKGIRKNHYLLERLLNIRGVNHLLTTWIGKHYNKAYKLDMLIKRVGEGFSLKQFYLQRVLILIITFFLANIIMLQIIHVTKDNDLNYVKDFETSSFASEIDDIKIYQDIIQKYCNQYVRKDVKVSSKKRGLQLQIEKTLKEQEKISNQYIVQLLSDEILRRITHYEKSYYHWYYLIISVLLSVLFSYIPYIILLLKKQLMQMSMEDEVMQFQAIIIMLMHIKKMNIETILDWLENFAEVFCPAIRECADTYSYDEELAFSLLKEKEPFLPFVRIVQNLEACDKVGIVKAFDEIKSDRNYFIEKRKQENEIIITNKAVIGKVLAYIPMFLTLVLYLILPFVLESISRLMGYIKQIQGF